MDIASLARIETGLAALRSQYQQAAGQLTLLQKQKEAKLQDLEQAQEDIRVWQLVQALFTKVSDYAREQLKRRVEQTVTAALQAVFADDDLEFRIEMRTVAGQPAADWQVVSRYGDTVVAASPEDGRGGGITDVVSLALRLALMELARPKPGGPVLLDEVGKHVSANYAPNVAVFLKEYARKTGRQVILITHQAALAEVADVSYQVSQRDGISEVRRV
ncbi:ATP-binding protein [Moorella sp. E306M]|uniref:ATP-binding protein n=1 Tax=Moorella sp. E306M TaxID=2572683 RepID=UPI0010FFABDF|nr:ATP-binding protein [Moorella sp. E306M]GEA17776.1 chromosome segregation ATPase [Moorella sp. E306M]GEA17845.1 chromosome segregation ATPase [Moorella sp. E306M]